MTPRSVFSAEATDTANGSLFRFVT